MPDQTAAAPAHVIPPQPGQFCEPHWSWLCQAGQGQCQRGENASAGAEEEG